MSSSLRSGAGAVGLVLLLTACASSAPVIDHRASNKTMGQYERDLAECRQYASQRNATGETLGGALGGAALGAALGAATGAISGNPATGAAYGAAIGGIGGGSMAGFNATSSQRGIVRRCMEGRGYRVLD